MGTVIFRQIFTKAAYGCLFTGAAVTLLFVSFVTGPTRRGGHAQSHLGLRLILLAIVALLSFLAVRAWRSCVVLEGDHLTVRAIFSTRRVSLAEISQFGLYKNWMRNAWLAGVKTGSGGVVKFPLWAASFVRDDPRNNKMVDYLREMQTVIAGHKDSPPGSRETITYQGNA